MASAVYSEDLTCCICLSLFTDPVTLLCGHSFCRQCITEILHSQHLCPQCRTAVPAGGTCLPTSHILKSLAEKAREAERREQEHGREKAQVAELCPEHEEKLKLFCVTDQQLACIICRDGEKHEGHKFKPIKEAAASLKKELETFVQHVSDDIHAIEKLANTQREEITKSKEKSQQLMTQICTQFEEMHQFLRKREDEIKNDLKHNEKDAVEKMSETLNAMETVLSESRELEGKATSVLEITDAERFLKSWTEGNSKMTAEGLFKPKANELQVVNTSLSLGPYESHLQFFTWKEMLQVIQPRAEELSLKSNSKNITVSDDGRSFFSSLKRQKLPSDPVSALSPNMGFGRHVTPPSFGSVQGFGRPMTPPSFRSGQGFGQPVTAPSFGSGQGFGQPVTAPSFGSGQGFGQPVTAPLFGSSQGFGQTTASPFGSGLQTNPVKHVDSSFSSSSSTNHAFSINKFSSGQHYWEIDVGHRDYWELGIKSIFLKYEGKKYSSCSPNTTTKLLFADRPRKIGIYLNCSSNKISFYDADSMKHIHTINSLMCVPLSAYFNIRHRESDPNPMTVCWY